jgi:uncharacterized membrane protein
MKRRREITGWRLCSKNLFGISMRFSAMRSVNYGHLPPLGGIQEDAMFGIQGHSTETLVELLSGVTLLISWIFVQVVFALYYAHEFYGKKAGSRNSGFEFPNNPLPDYSDFIRFALVIGMRIQVPRVQVTSRKMRRVVIVQCIVSFILNLSIVMLAIIIVSRRYR